MKKYNRSTTNWQDHFWPLTTVACILDHIKYIPLKGCLKRLYNVLNLDNMCHDSIYAIVIVS